MTEQERKNIKPFLKELLKMQQAIYLACDAEVAADVSLKTAKAITLISKLMIENEESGCLLKLTEYNLMYILENNKNILLPPSLTVKNTV